MNYRILIKSWRQLALVLVILSVMVTPSFAVDYYLVAKEFTKTMPDPDGGGPLPVPPDITMWGFVEDTGGACYNTAGDAGALACASALPDPTVPPQLTADPGIGGAADTLRIFLTNALTVPTSIIIPGQEMPWSASKNGPTWDDGSVGARGGDLQRRVRSFGREAAPDGGRTKYVWSNSRNNPFQPGTFLYQSGTDPSLQVHMGLYGAVTKDAAVGQAYPGTSPGTSYDAEVILLYSEIDPALHDPAPTPAKPLNYKPTWFLVNGEPYEDGVTPPETAGDTSGTTLIRFLNAGLKSHAPTLVNGPHMSVIAEDGHLLPYGREQYSVRLGAGKTSDALWNPTAAGRYPIYDRTLQLTNAGVTGGGMLSYLDVAAANQPPVAKNDDAATTPCDGTTILCSDVAILIDVVANDTDGDGTIDPTTVCLRFNNCTNPNPSNSKFGGLVTNNFDGTVTYQPPPDFEGKDNFRYQVDDDRGATSNRARVRVNVVP
jgi:hypothetical protein